MKYFIIENREKELHGMHNEIADFFWNAGNSVYISCHHDVKADRGDIIVQCDCIILLQGVDCSTDFFFENNLLESLYDDIHLREITQKPKLIFSAGGVYSSVIPYPHKIYHFDGFTKNELTSFFNWCRKLNLFQPYGNTN